MQNILNWLSGRKTYFICIGSIVALWTAYLQGTVDLNNAVQGTVAALAGMTLRAAIAKSGPTGGN